MATFIPVKSERERGKCAETWKMHTLYYLLELRLKNPKVSSRGMKVDPRGAERAKSKFTAFFSFSCAYLPTSLPSKVLSPPW